MLLPPHTPVHFVCAAQLDFHRFSVAMGLAAVRRELRAHPQPGANGHPPLYIITGRGEEAMLMTALRQYFKEQGVQHWVSRHEARRGVIVVRPN